MTPELLIAIERKVTIKIAASDDGKALVIFGNPQMINIVNPTSPNMRPHLHSAKIFKRPGGCVEAFEASELG